MVAKRHRYTLAAVAWGLLTIGGMVAVVSGRTEPYLAVSDLPVGDAVVGFAGFGAALAGWILIALLRRRAWRTAGRAVGLSPDSGLLGRFGFPTLSGSVRGRAVRVRTISEGSGETSSRKTLVEAPLPGAADTGVVVGRTTSGDPASAAPGFGSVSAETTAVDGEFWAVGDEALAREVLTREVREALADVGEVDGVYAGDVAGVLEEGTPDAGGSLGERLVSHTMKSMTPGDATTVTYKLDAVVVDGADLGRRVHAVAAVAEAFEAATAENGPRAGVDRQW